MNSEFDKISCSESQNDTCGNLKPFKSSDALTEMTPVAYRLTVFTRIKLFNRACAAIVFQLLPPPTFHFLEFYLDLVVFKCSTKPHTNTDHCTAAAYKMTTIIRKAV